MSNEGRHIDEKGELISLADRLRYLIGRRSYPGGSESLATLLLDP